MMPWKDAALQRHYCSSISLPIMRLGNVIGTYSLYADTAGFWYGRNWPAGRMCGDISLRWILLKRTDSGARTELALSESEKRYQTLTKFLPWAFSYRCHRLHHLREPALVHHFGHGAGCRPRQWLVQCRSPGRRELLERVGIRRWMIVTQSFSEYRFCGPMAAFPGWWVWPCGKKCCGEIIGYVGTITDITARILAEQEMLKEKNVSDTLINALPGCLFIQPGKKDWYGGTKSWTHLWLYFAELKGKHQRFYWPGPTRSGSRKIKAVIERRNRRAGQPVYLKNGQKVPYYFTGILYTMMEQTAWLVWGIGFYRAGGCPGKN